LIPRADQGVIQGADGAPAQEQVCRVVRVPSIAQEDERRLSRERERLPHERNSHIAPLDAMLCYKQLTMVEQAFRTTTNLFETRPIFHKLDETIRGHVSCSFLALVLKKALEDRVAELGKPGSWPEILADLDSLTETEVEQDNKRFMLRSAPRPAGGLALRAVGVEPDLNLPRSPEMQCQAAFPARISTCVQ
jgi:hypothetical protein